eukprot:s210_g5.t1
MFVDMRSGLAMPLLVLDHVSLGSLPLQSLSCVGFLPATFDIASLAPSTSLQRMTRLGFTVLIFASSRCHSSPLVLDPAVLGSSPTGLSRTGLAALALCSHKIEVNGNLERR